MPGTVLASQVLRVDGGKKRPALVIYSSEEKSVSHEKTHRCIRYSECNKCYLGFPGDSGSKESTCQAGYPGSIPGAGRPPGEENGNPLQYSCLENPMDRRAWWTIVYRVTKIQTQLKRLSIHVCTSLILDRK